MYKGKTAARNKTRREHLSVIFAVIFICLGLAVYASSMRGGFIWDDAYLIKDNSYIKDWRSIPSILSKDIAAGAKAQSNFYRPVQILSYLVDYSFWKDNVIGFHLTNVILHVIAALLVMRLAMLLSSNRFVSASAGILFLVHPVQTEAVSYLSGRADLLAAVFVLLFMILYIRSMEYKDPARYAASLIVYVLALLSRESALIAVLVLVLYHYAFNKKIDLARFLPPVCLAVIYVIIRFTVFSDLLPHKVIDTTLWQRVPGFFVALTNYAKLLAAPFGLHMEYGNQTFSMADPKAVIGLIILASCAFIAVKIKKYNKLAFFSLVWSFLLLFPQSNIYPVNAYMAEHWLYLPCVGVFLLLAGALDKLYSRSGYRQYAITAIIGLTAFYSFVSARQNSYWSEPVAFYERVLKYAPGNFRAHNSLGIQYETKGEFDKAMDSYKRAIEANPYFGYAYHNLGKVSAQLGRNDDAIAWYKKALEVSPDLGGTYHNMGNTYKDMGRFDDAVASYRKAIEAYPDYAEAYFNLGTTYKAKGDLASAITSYRKAIDISPRYANAYNNLGNIFTETARYEEAGQAYEKAIACDPRSPDAYNNLGALYSYEGQNGKALEMFLKAADVDPGYAQAHNNAAVIYLERRDYQRALEHCNAAVRLGQPDAALIEELRPYRNNEGK